MVHLLAGDYTDAVFAVGNSNLEGGGLYGMSLEALQRAHWRRPARERSIAPATSRRDHTGVHIAHDKRARYRVHSSRARHNHDVMWMSRHHLGHHDHAPRQLEARHQNLRRGHGHAAAPTTVR